MLQIRDSTLLVAHRWTTIRPTDEICNCRSCTINPISVGIFDQRLRWGGGLQDPENSKKGGGGIPHLNHLFNLYIL